MPYIVKARYYAEADQFGETYVITSNNMDPDTKLEVGCLIQLMENCVHELVETDNGEGYLCVNCKRLYGKAKNSKDIITCILSDGSKIKSQREHMIMTSDGWVEMKDLKVGDKVLYDNKSTIVTSLYYG